MKLTAFMAATAAVALAASTAEAVTFGVAVDGVGGNVIPNQGNIDNNAGTAPAILTGPNIIEYFIPLSGPNCTYGVGGCGTGVDTGTGGTNMSMFLEFGPLTVPGLATLTLEFEDLDLDGVNDPAGFLESIQVFDGNGTPLTNLITDVTNPNPPIIGDADTQQVLPISLGILTATPFYAELVFAASAPMVMTNTPEYLRASVDTQPAVIGEVPLPAPALMLLSALGGLGFLSWRRRTA